MLLKIPLDMAMLPAEYANPSFTILVCGRIVRCHLCKEYLLCQMDIGLPDRWHGMLSGIELYH